MQDDKIMYLEDGAEVIFIQKLDDGYLYRPIYHYDDEGDDIIGEITFAKILYDKPLLTKYHEQIEIIKNEINELDEKRRKLHSEYNEYNKMAERLKNYKVLKYIDDMILSAKSITHLAVLSSSAQVVEANYWTTQSLYLIGEKSKALSDLTFVCKAEIDGYYRDVILCKSEKEAREIVQEYINTQCEKATDREIFYYSRIIEQGFTFPQKYLDMIKNQKRKSRERDVKEKRHELQEAEEALRKCNENE